MKHSLEGREPTGARIMRILRAHDCYYFNLWPPHSRLTESESLCIYGSAAAAFMLIAAIVLGMALN